MRTRFLDTYGGLGIGIPTHIKVKGHKRYAKKRRLFSNNLNERRKMYMFVDFGFLLTSLTLVYEQKYDP